MCISVSLSSWAFLNFACAAFIGDNVDTEKSIILKLVSILHAPFESMPWKVYNSFLCEVQIYMLNIVIKYYIYHVCEVPAIFCQRYINSVKWK